MQSDSFPQSEERQESRAKSCPEVRDDNDAGPRKDMSCFFSAFCFADTHRYHRYRRCADAGRSMQSRLHSIPPRAAGQDI